MTLATTSDLAFENVLENDLAALLRNYFSGITVHLYTSSDLPRCPVYPAVVVRTDQCSDAGFGRFGVFSADLLIGCRSYRMDDRQAAAVNELARRARLALFAPDLVGRLNAASGKYTYFAAIPGNGYAEPEIELIGLVLQLQVKFSPTR